MKTIKIYQVQGNGKAHYVASISKSVALKAAKEIWPIEKINFASDKTKSFTNDEINDLPEYVINV